MTPEALRIAVAEAMGWKRTTNQAPNMAAGVPFWVKNGDYRFAESLPNYTNSLDACLPLIERFREEGWTDWIISNMKEAGFYVCAFYSANNEEVIAQSPDHPATAFCYAFLKAMNDGGER